tara:strand:- start:3413 stop:4678 length:1266 start_codon:yes stop_codon:yes gene_type:complete
MARLDDLQLTLNNQATAEGELAGLDEQYARAEALRGRQQPKVNQYGTVSPLAVLANVVGNSNARKQLRELEPQRAAARASIAASKNALPMYNAKLAEEAVNLKAANRTEDRGWATTDTAAANAFTAGQNALKAGALVKSQRALAEAKAAEEAKKEAIRVEKEGQTATDFTQMVDANGSTVNVSRRHDGQWVNGRKEPINIDGLNEVPKVTITSDNSGYKSDAANKRAEEYINSLGAANRIRGLYNNLSPEKLEQLSSLPTRVAKTFFNALPENVAGLVNQEFEKDPQAKRYFSELAKMSAVERHAMFGGALTEYEGMSAGQFLAFVINMTPAEQQARMQGSVEGGLQSLRTSDAVQGGSGSTKYMDAYNSMNFGNLVFDQPVPQEGSVNAVNNSAEIREIDAKMAALQAQMDAIDANTVPL